MRPFWGLVGLPLLFLSSSLLPAATRAPRSGPAAGHTTAAPSTAVREGGGREGGALIELSGSIQPFVEAFNAEKGVPRLVAILSPTCPACRHGSEAIDQVLSGDFAAGRLRLLVVWAPMLQHDDEAAARQAVARFSGFPVTQFYDPRRRIGEAFRREVFPRAADEMRRSLPSGHYMKASLAGRSNGIPEWDIYMFFEKGTAWGSTAPRPAHWVRQIARVRKGDEGPISVMWTDSYTLPPKEGSLAEQLERAAAGVRTAKHD